MKNIFFAFVVCFSISFRAQPPHVFTQYSTNDGLEQNTIRKIIQDKKGFLWLATWDGICRFDGHTFKNYKNSIGKLEPSFISNRISYIEEDAFGCIWALGYDKRISRFNPHTERLMPILENDCLVKRFFILPNGHIWLVTENKGLLLVTTNKDCSTNIENISQKAGIAFDVKINRVFIDQDKNEWILTESGIYHYSAESITDKILGAGCAFTDVQETAKYLYFGSEKGEIWQYHKNTGLCNIIALPTKARITVLRFIKTELLICGTNTDGFFLLSTNGKYKQHYNKAVSKDMPDNTIKDIYIDKKGEAWIKQAGVGVTHFDSESGTITHLVMKDEKGNLISGTHQEQIIVEDIQGNLYIHPSGGGFAYYDRTTRKLIPIYNKQLMTGWHKADLIMDIYADKQGNIWFSSFKNGLEKISFNDKQFSLYSPLELQKEQIDSRVVFIDKEKRLWIGFKHIGVGIYDAAHKFLGYLRTDGTLSISKSDLQIMAYTITQDHEGTVWIGTKKSGVIAAKPGNKPQTFKLSHFRFDSNDNYSLSNNDVWQIYEDNQLRLWFTTWDGGINYLDRKNDGTFRFINYRNELKNYPIKTCKRARSIVADRKGNIWVATPDGLLVFNENFTDPSQLIFKQVKHIPNDNKSLNNNDIQFLYVTSQQYLYIATFGGGLNKLVAFEEGEPRFEAYTKRDGLLSNILLAMEEDPKGNVWISMIEGLSKFSPEKKAFENYSVGEFTQSVRFNDGAGCYSILDKTLLFNTGQGVLSFNPESVHKSTYIPSIVFTQLQLGNYTIMPNDSTKILNNNVNEMLQLTLNHRQNSFSVHFAALDMTDPPNISYSYQLEGFEDIWHQAGNSHIGSYTNIPKGDYKLKVQSTNSDGVWVSNIRELPIRILPTFWESYWGKLFYTLIVIIILFIIFTYYRLRQKVQLEQTLSVLKQQFFTNISHELRTPLTLISGPLKNILEQDNLHSDVRSQLQIVDRNTDRMNYLVNQILDFRKIQNHKMLLCIQPLELISFIHHLMSFFEELANERQIDFLFETQSPSYTLWVDRDKFEKILFNLISNAFKYTLCGKQIKITVTNDDENVLISISDQGIGIHQDEQKRLFKRFEVITDSQLLNQPSTGIGLSFAKELVEMHKGNIYIQSEPGKGATFIIKMKKGKNHFDINDVTIVDREASINEYTPNDFSFLESCEEKKVLSETISHTDIDKKTLLIVEDNRELRYFLRTIFTSEFHILETENGVSGLDIARIQQPDIIISDIMMPEKNGVELLRELRLDISISHIPVVLLTAKSSIENQILGIQLGADDYITKPFNVYYLKARVMNILDQRQKLQQYYSSLLFTVNSLEDTLVESVTDTITSNNQSFMNRLIESVNKNLGNGDLTIEDLAQEIGMSRNIFFKKIKNLTGLSPIEFLKDIRLKRAAKLIKSSDLNMSQIAFHVGFNDAHYFSKCFKLKFGITPTEYREGK